MANSQEKFDNAALAYERTGYIISKGVSHPLLNAVAAPVKRADGAASLMLSAGGINSIFNDATLKMVGEDLIALANLLRPTLSLDTKA